MAEPKPKGIRDPYDMTSLETAKRAVLAARVVVPTMKPRAKDKVGHLKEPLLKSAGTQDTEEFMRNRELVKMLDIDDDFDEFPEKLIGLKKALVGFTYVMFEMLGLVVKAVRNVNTVEGIQAVEGP